MLSRLFAFDKSSWRTPGLSRTLYLALACVASSALSAIATDALLVEAVSIEELSLWFIVAALLRVAGALGYGQLARWFLRGPQRRRRFGRWFDAAFVAAIAVGELVCGLALQHASLATLFGIIVLQTLGPPLLPLIAFVQASDTLDARRAKYLLPVVAAASTVGTILAGLVAHHVAPRWGASSLLVMGGLVGLSAIPCLRAQAPSRGPGESDGLRGLVREMRTIPSVRMLLIATGLAAFVSNVADFGLKTSLQASYDVDQIASYLGLTNAVINGLVLVLQLSVTGRLVARYGVGMALVVGPALMACVAIPAAVAPMLLGATVLRVVDQVFRYGIGNAAADLLVVPVPSAVRARAKLAAKAVFSPLGALLSSLVLTGIARTSNRTLILSILLVVASVLTIVILRSARSAYAHALELALGRGLQPADLSADAVALYRDETQRRLTKAVGSKDATTTRRILGTMTDRHFGAADTKAALHSGDPVIEKFAVQTAIALAREDQGDLLLALSPELRSSEAEAMIFEAAVSRGAVPDRSRIERGLSLRERAHAEPVLARHFGAAMVAKCRALQSGRKEAAFFAAIKDLRKLALSNDSPLRAAALSALRELGQTQATREVQLALGSTRPDVFFEAARAGLALRVQGATALVVARLCSGPCANIAARALTNSGAVAVHDLLEALPTTRGEGMLQPTAVASSRTVGGSVRAARALARLGKNAVADVLPRLPTLGFRARASLAHAIGAAHIERSDATDKLILAAMGQFCEYGSFLTGYESSARPTSLFARELRLRRLACVEAILDLACVDSDRLAISRARVALEAGGSRRATALELLENVVPTTIAQRVAVLADFDPTADTANSELVGLEGWLLLCRNYDEAKLDAAMTTVFDRIELLKDVPLFARLTAEELFSVAEIARETSVPQGSEIVRQGDPADDLYVVMRGTCEIIIDEVPIGVAKQGQAFGELGVLDGEPRAATVRARTDATLLRIPRAELEALIDESPELARSIITVLLGYLREKRTRR